MLVDGDARAQYDALTSSTLLALLPSRGPSVLREAACKLKILIRPLVDRAGAVGESNFLTFVDFDSNSYHKQFFYYSDFHLFLLHYQN